MIGRVDLVMWAKNGAMMLPTVLKRVDEVIPTEAVGKKVFVDDHSVDGSPSIAKEFGWQVFPNEKGGVGAGANVALRQVTNEYFMSLEQDVILAKDWWEKIPRYVKRKDVAVAQGWRVSDNPILRKIDEYAIERFNQELHSIDNNIYKTKIIKALGGFPEHIKYTGVDPHLRLRVLKAGFKWVTDISVISIHLRKGGLWEQMRRHYHSGQVLSDIALEKLFIERKIDLSLRKPVIIALYSPFRGFEIALRKRSPKVAYYYPLIRFSFLVGTLIRRT